MTFEKAVELYWQNENSKPSDFLFDGEENIVGEALALDKAFGLSVIQASNLCDDCVHREACPFMCDGEEVCESCNFHDYGEAD